MPFITTVTMPPPAVASIRMSAICFCMRSCICWACFIICWMFIRDPLSVQGSGPERPIVSSTSLISVPNTSSIACTLLSASACWRSSDCRS